MLKRRQVLLAVGASVSGLSLPALGQTADSSLKGTPIENIKLTHLTVNKNAPVVFYSPSVSPQAVLDIFKAVGLPVQGKVGLKVVFGNQRDRAKMIDPALLKPIADELHATLIESNYMDSARSNAAAHLATAKSLGYDKVAPIDILDAEKEIAIPVHNSYHLKNFITTRWFQSFVSKDITYRDTAERRKTFPSVWERPEVRARYTVPAKSRTTTIPLLPKRLPNLWQTP